MVTYIQWGQGVRTCATLRGVRNPKAEGDEDQEVGFITVSPLTLILPIFRWSPKPVHKESRTSFPEDSRHSILSKQDGKERSAIEIDSLTWLPQEWWHSSLTEAQMAAFKPKDHRGLWGQCGDIFYTAGNTVMSTLSSVSYGRNTGDIYSCHFISITGNILSPVNRNTTEPPSSESWHLPRVFLFHFGSIEK